MTAVSAHAPHHETQATTSTPSARPPSVRDDVVVQEIRRIIESDHCAISWRSGQGYFTGINSAVVTQDRRAVLHETS